jgi:hypothetical protein
MTRGWARYLDQSLLWIASTYWLNAPAWIAQTYVLPPPVPIMADSQADLGRPARPVFRMITCHGLLVQFGFSGHGSGMFSSARMVRWTLVRWSRAGPAGV